MKRFDQIDKKLNALAKKYRVAVATSGSVHSIDKFNIPQNKVQIRKILWIDDIIGKGIIIEPNFENRNIDAPDWNILNIAWLNSSAKGSRGLPFWQKFLLKKVKFEEIEKNIDQLLQSSIDNLAAVQKTDLGYYKNH